MMRIGKACGCLLAALVLVGVPAVLEAQTVGVAPGLVADPDASAVPAVPGPFVAPLTPRSPLYVSECSSVGGFARTFEGGNRFRGNVFAMSEDRQLVEIKTQLDFMDLRTLYFSIHEKVDGTDAYTRLTDDVVVTVQGVGNSFYSSGEFAAPVLLEGGKSYAIGVTWGTGGTLIYGRDNDTYPQAYPGFSVLGGVAANVTPPLPDEVASLIPYESGAYSMEVCFLPRPGACCVYENGFHRCEHVTEGECLAMGGPGVIVEFTAAGVACGAGGATCPLPQGACCLGTYPNAICVDNLNEYSCIDQGGTWHEGEGCPLACVPKGACCNGEVCLDGQTEEACETDLNGVYQGDDTTCDGLELPCSAGACCIGSTCVFESTEQQCEDSFGSFAGPGTRCDQEPCTPRGACCLGLNDCQDGYSESECTAAGGHYRGDATSCALIDAIGVPCYKGACCTDSLGCVQRLSESLCWSIGGTWQGEGTDCETSADSCDGKCCWAGGCASGVLPSECADQLGGDFIGYGVCETGDCPATDLGACCRPDGTCIKTVQDTCESSFLGTFHLGMDCGEVTCDQPPAVGACCLPGEVCANGISEADCLMYGGAFNGVGTTCTVNTCQEGACCLASGGCAVTVSFDCVLPDVFFAGTSCDPDPCEDHACCRGEGDCVETTELSCLAQQGMLLDVDVCEAFTCVDGACCEGGSSCSDGYGGECAAIGGDFIPGSECSYSPCTGEYACCVPGMGCQNTDDIACLNLQGTWMAPYRCESFEFDYCCDSGDPSGDGLVDMVDYSILQRCWGVSDIMADGGACSCLDMDNDNAITIDDYDMFYALFSVD